MITILTVKNDNICTYFELSFMLSFLGCYHLCYHWCYHFSRSANIIIFMLSFSLVYICVIIYVIIWCYHFLRSANIIIFMLSFSLVHILCYHLCYHLMLSFIVIISPLFSFSWKRDTLVLKWYSFDFPDWIPFVCLPGPR